MEAQTHEAWFSYYCPTCKYRNVKEGEDPCNECMNQGYNFNTHRPINYDQDTNLKNIDPTPNCLEKIAHHNGDYKKIFGKYDPNMK